jgi:ABC-type multidrug transport system permease subunit
MRFVLAAALKDLRRIRSDPTALLVWVGVPVVIALLLKVMFGGGSVTPHGKLLVADEDNTFISGLLSGGFDRGPLANMISVEQVEPGPGRERMDRGEASALLIIPKGLAQAVLQNQPFQVNLITNPSQQIMPNIIEQVISMMADADFYVQEFAGDQLRGLAGDQVTLSDQDLTGLVLEARRKFTAIQHYVDPPLIQLKTQVVEEKSVASKGFMEVFFPTILFMSLLFIAMGVSNDVWNEKRQGTLRRVVTSPSGLGAMLAGKTLATGLVLAAVAAAGTAGAHWLLGITVHLAGLALAWIVVSCLVLYLFLLLLQMFASNEHTAHLLVNVIVFPLIMLGGCFFPFEAMPAGMAAIGKMTPNGWALVQFKAIMAGSIGPGTLALDGAGILALGILAFFLAARRLRGSFVS